MNRAVATAWDETPRPEPRGLRPIREGTHGPRVRILLQDETPRPEPRGLRLSAYRWGFSLMTSSSGRNTETRTEGIATEPFRFPVPDAVQGDRDETPRPEPRGLRPYLRSPHRRVDQSGATKHRDPNRGDCDVVRADPSLADSQTSFDETLRPEPRGLRLTLGGPFFMGRAFTRL